MGLDNGIDALARQVEVQIAKTERRLEELPEFADQTLADQIKAMKGVVENGP